MRKDPESEWKPAVVVAKHDTPRSYVIKTEDGTEYRRNRKHLMKPQEERPPPPLHMNGPLADQVQMLKSQESPADAVMTPPLELTSPKAVLHESAGLGD